jgi:hypothetical protein
MLRIGTAPEKISLPGEGGIHARCIQRFADVSDSGKDSGAGHRDDHLRLLLIDQLRGSLARGAWFGTAVAAGQTNFPPSSPVDDLVQLWSEQVNNEGQGIAQRGQPARPRNDHPDAQFTYFWPSARNRLV